MAYSYTETFADIMQIINMTPGSFDYNYAGMHVHAFTECMNACVHVCMFVRACVLILMQSLRNTVV